MLTRERCSEPKPLTWTICRGTSVRLGPEFAPGMRCRCPFNGTTQKSDYRIFILEGLCWGGIVDKMQNTRVRH